MTLSAQSAAQPVPLESVPLATEHRPELATIELSNFRGIASGSLVGLGQLTILTGTNGCGKSSVVDALLCGASIRPGQALQIAVSRHSVSRSGGSWLRFRGPEGDSFATVTLKSTAEQSLTRRFVLDDDAGFDEPQLQALKSPGPYYRLRCEEQLSGPESTQVQTVGSATFGADNRAITAEHPPQSTRPLVCETLLVDPRRPTALNNVFSSVKRSARGPFVDKLLAEVGITDLQLLMDVDGKTPTLFVRRDGAVIPLALAGSGLYSLVQTTLSLASVDKGLVLLEEPESFQHPASLYQTALGLVEGARRGLQIVITSHSEELIDSILTHLGRDEAERAVLFTLALRNGSLLSSRRAGLELWEARLQRSQGVR
jgi:hypothetical protein